MTDLVNHLAREAARGRISRREFLGRAAALGVVPAVAGTMLSKAVMAQGPQKGGTLKLGMATGATTDAMDPALWTNQVPYTFGKCWGETLVVTSPVDGSPVPVLAESWSASDDALSWQFKVRQGVTFHDGKELTADDVVATIRRHSDENSQSGALGLLGDIESVEADGKHSFVVKLKAPDADLPLVISDYHMVIQPNGGLDNPTAGIGTGPYKVEVAEQGVRLVGVKHEGYWSQEVGHVDAVEILVINDATARMSALQSGQVHIINRIDPKSVGFLERAGEIVIENTAGKGHYTFPMHADTDPFTNYDLRMALKLAVDREQMVKQILLGYGTAGNDFPINEAYELFPEGIEQRQFDPDKAKFHYEKSGHSGPVVFRTSDVAFPGAIDAAVLYQQSAAKAGIQIEVIREPGDGYWSNVWNTQPFSASYWSGRPTQALMYATAYVSSADWNESAWRRPEFDALHAQVRAELDEAKRKELYREMALMVRDDGGLILPMFNDFIDARSKQVQGFVRDRAGELSNNYIGIRAWLDQA